MKQRIKLSVLPILAMMVLTACPKSQYVKAANASKDFAGATKAFQDVVIAARHSTPPLVDAKEDIQLEGLIKKMAQINDKFADGIALASKGQSAATDFDAAITLASTLDAENLDFVKNEKTKAELQVAFTLARGAITTIRLILNK